MRRLKIISIVMLLSIVALLPKSNAALVSKPGTSPLVNTTVSNSYLLCQKMKGLGESLYGAGSNVQPHLATNKDWGAVSYLSNSIYGTNTKGGDTGLEVTIGGVKYYSTNGNISGVMNWGNMQTQTSALIKAYMNLSDKTISSAHDYVIELENQAKNNSKYVEIIDTKSNGANEPTTGMAILETKRLATWAGIYADTNYPGSVRKGLFGYGVGPASGTYPSGSGSGASGRPASNVTFRPVVWN